jgi:hypothetical protein
MDNVPGLDEKEKEMKEPMTNIESDPVTELVSEPTSEVATEPTNELANEPVTELDSQPVIETVANLEETTEPEIGRIVPVVGPEMEMTTVRRSSSTKRKRCHKGSRRNKSSHRCRKNNKKKRTKKCHKGSRRNKKTRRCRKIR